jgi:NADH:ubiquinone oxidoreductase subunit E
LEAELSHLPPQRTNLLPALHLVQESLGHLPGWALQCVGRQLHIPASEVHGVASGYTEFRFGPPPATLVQICTGLSCRLGGADALLTGARERHGGEVETIPCLFACSLAPVALVGVRLLGRATAQLVADSAGNAQATVTPHDD